MWLFLIFLQNVNLGLKFYVWMKDKEPMQVMKVCQFTFAVDPSLTVFKYDDTLVDCCGLIPWKVLSTWLPCNQSIIHCLETSQFLQRGISIGLKFSSAATCLVTLMSSWLLDLHYWNSYLRFRNDKRTWSFIKMKAKCWWSCICWVCLELYGCPNSTWQPLLFVLVMTIRLSYILREKYEALKMHQEK